MSSTPPGTASSSAASNVHEYLHLAPPYAQPAPSPSNSNPTTSPSGSPFLLAPSTTAASNAKLKSIGNNEPEPWEEEEMRAIVLEYLLSGSYRDSAQSFASEIATRRNEERLRKSEGQSPEGPEVEEDGMQGIESTPPPQSWKPSHRDELDDDSTSEPRIGEDAREEAVDGILTAEQLRDARVRQTIRESILAGRITQATSLINLHYPSVLVPSPPPASSPSKLPPLHSQSPKRSTSCTPKTFFVLPELTSSSTSSPLIPPAPVSVVGQSFGSWATSLAPEILSLNLQLQSFVELMRTGHATSALSTPSTPSSSVNGVNPPTATATTAVDETGMSSSITSLASSTISTSLLSTAITSSQALLASIQALLPSKDKESWERECVDVCGLLAYKDLANCPVRGYLETSRREGLAEMVNSAILQRTNRTPLPLLELAARSATAVWGTLAEMKVQFPPIRPTTTTTNQNGTTKTKVTKTFPSFDFAQFVNHNLDPRSTTLAATAKKSNTLDAMQT